MKIAVFKYFLYPEVEGGTTTFVRDFTRVMARTNQVTVFSCTREQTLAERVMDERVEIYRVHVPHGSLGLLRFTDKRRYQSQFDGKLDGFDILNVQGVHFLSLRSFRQWRAKIFITFHASLKKEIGFSIRKNLPGLLLRPWELVRESVKYFYAGFLEKRKLAMAAGIVVMSEYVKSYLLAMYPHIPAAKVTVIPIGVDGDRYMPGNKRDTLRDSFGLGKMDTCFFTLRRHVDRMGLENLIKAVDCLRQESGSLKGLLFVVGGKGPLTTRLRELVTAYGLEGHIVFPGYIKEDELGAFYGMADCFILPTEELEGFGIVTIEALASNLPVIGTATGATPEILQHFQKELIAEDSCPEKLADKIRLYLQKYRHQKPDNRERALMLYNWESIRVKYEDLFSRKVEIPE